MKQSLNDSAILDRILNFALSMGEQHHIDMGNSMDELQQQILDLESKVDRLHEVVERISTQITAVVLEKESRLETRQEPLDPLVSANYRSTISKGRFQTVMEHKDVLIDDPQDNKLTTANGEQGLSPEVQIRRLTAQLTAAYNRIAALEEQLLDCRIHS